MVLKSKAEDKTCCLFKMIPFNILKVKMNIYHGSFKKKGGWIASYIKSMYLHVHFYFHFINVNVKVKWFLLPKINFCFLEVCWIIFFWIFYLLFSSLRIIIHRTELFRETRTHFSKLKHKRSFIWQWVLDKMDTILTFSSHDNRVFWGMRTQNIETRFCSVVWGMQSSVYRKGMEFQSTHFRSIVSRTWYTFYGWRW